MEYVIIKVVKFCSSRHERESSNNRILQRFLRLFQIHFVFAIINKFYIDG